MGFVDLHLHLLPGIDDGSKSIEESVAMGKALVSLGYTHAAPSPHRRHEYLSKDVALCAVRLNEVKAEFGKEGVALALYSNAEHFFLEEDLLPSLGTTAQGVGASSVLLVEAPYTTSLPMLNEMIFRMGLKGVTPLIAHPERCFEFEKKGRAAELVAAGALLQLDMGALIGRYGKTAQKLARQFLDDGLYAVAATDLHSPVKAEAWLGESLKALEKAVGAQGFSELVEKRPRRVLEGLTD